MGHRLLPKALFLCFMLMAVSTIMVVNGCVPGGADTKSGRRSVARTNGYIDAHNHLFGMVKSRLGG